MLEDILLFHFEMLHPGAVCVLKDAKLKFCSDRAVFRGLANHKTG